MQNYCFTGYITFSGVHGKRTLAFLRHTIGSRVSGSVEVCKACFIVAIGVRKYVGYNAYKGDLSCISCGCTA